MLGIVLVLLMLLGFALLVLAIVINGSDQADDFGSHEMKEESRFYAESFELKG
jgi:hypothetical protein